MSKTFGFDPKTTKYPYPIDTDKHYLEVKKNDGTIFDEKYPYVDHSFKYRIKWFFMHVIMVLIAFPVCAIRQGLKIINKNNLRKHKDEIKNGVISICNHIHMWDFISMNMAIFPHTSYILVWDKNMRGENKVFCRYVGGIPVPTDNIRATAMMSKAVVTEIKNGGWVHFNPEGSMWEFYKPIRPFKQGAFYYSVKTERPIIPFGYSFRKPGIIDKNLIDRLQLL